jgi:hypothetical protein
MLEIRFPSSMAMDQPALLAEGLSLTLRAPVSEPLVLDLTDVQRVSAFGLAALAARLMWLIRTRRMPTGSTIRRPESNRVGNDLLRMGLYRLMQEASDRVYHVDPTLRPQELWVVDHLEDLPLATSRLVAMLKLVIPAADENWDKIELMMQAMGANVFTYGGGNAPAVLCAQGYPKSGVIEFAVADAGMGVLSSLQQLGVEAMDDTHAINLALSGVKGGKPGGMATLAGTAKYNRGEMSLISGGAWWMYRATAVTSGICKPYPGTVIGLKLPIVFKREGLLPLEV